MKIGIIGYGLRIRSLHVLLSKVFPDCKVVAIVDPRIEEIRTDLGAEAESITFLKVQMRCFSICN